MKRASTKILAVVLSLMMLFGVIPFTASAATPAEEAFDMLASAAAFAHEYHGLISSMSNTEDTVTVNCGLANSNFAGFTLTADAVNKWIELGFETFTFTVGLSADSGTVPTHVDIYLSGTDFFLTTPDAIDGTEYYYANGREVTLDLVKLLAAMTNAQKNLKFVMTNGGSWTATNGPASFTFSNVKFLPEQQEVPEGTVTIDQEISNGTISVGDAFANPGETVTVTVTPADGYQLKVGSLRANGKPVTTRVNKGVDETTCNQFTFVKGEDDVEITAEFISATEANMAVLGAAFKEEDLRFVSRAYRTKGGAALVAAGQLLMRADCDLAAAIEDGVAVADIDALLARAAEGATGANAVKNISTTMLNDRCTDYIDFAVRINGAGAETYKNVEYVCISYATYADGATVYSAACTRSYNDVNPSQEPEPSPADEAFTMLASPAAFAHEYHGLISGVSNTKDTVTVNCGLANSAFAGFTLTPVAVSKWLELGFETFTFTVGLSADSGTVPTHVDIYLSGTDFFLTEPDVIDGTVEYYYADGREVKLDLVKLLAAMENVGQNLKFVMTNGGSWTATNGPASFTFSNIQFN